MSQGRSDKSNLAEGGKKMEGKDQDFRFLQEPHFFEVCIVVKDLEKSLEQFRSLFDMTPYLVREIKIPGLNVHGERVPKVKIKYAYFHAGPMRLELLEPVEGKSIWMEFLRVVFPYFLAVKYCRSHDRVDLWEWFPHLLGLGHTCAAKSSMRHAASDAPP